MAYLPVRSGGGWRGMGDFTSLLQQIQQDVNQGTQDFNMGINDVKGAYVTQQAQNWSSLTSSPVFLIVIGLGAYLLLRGRR